jgi:mannose-6-phosphate isomerase-like protein (cupin superfamily)
MTGFTIADALSHLVLVKADFARLVENRNYDIGIYRPDGSDRQTPHTRDEVYVVGSGTGEFVCADETKAFNPGDLFFVPAGVEHRFVNFSKDFSAWVVFFGPRPSN